MGNWKYFDAHGHINSKAFDGDRDEVIKRAKEADVAMITVGTDRNMSALAVALADAMENRWATVGQHPTDNHAESFDMNQYREWVARADVVAIGECGLDYYWPASEGWLLGEVEEKMRQKELFEAQISLSFESGKPLMIHGRPTVGTMDAYEDIIAQIKSANESYAAKLRGNVHFFVGDINIAKQFLELGFTMSFTGVITFSHDYDEVIKFLPITSILAETDAPFVAPKLYRGKRNEPIHVREVYARLAELKGLSDEEVSVQLNANVERQFSL